jgi:hypothetical protein
VIRPGAVGRQVASVMRGAEFQSRKSIQCALENQMGKGNGGFKRIADDVGRQAVALEPFREIRNALGMQEHQNTKLLCLGPEGVKLRIGQLLAVDAPADRDATEPQTFDAILYLLSRQVRM